uniref:Calcineurin-like phosphoesterase domain-containing protein n=1 Tax=Romanomermis culicivorax TaxID=13658 RepID=A0A915I4F7_ROMCU
MASSSKPKGPKDRHLAEKRWKWIENQLSNSTAEYLFIAGHYPVYSTADHGPTQCLIDKLNPLMQKYNVTAYLSGHDHNLQHLRVNLNDTLLNYVISGAGAFTDVSTANLKNVPPNSSLFSYPRSSWFNILNNAGIGTDGGFVLVKLDSKSANFTYFNGYKEKLYSFEAFPRFL